MYVNALGLPATEWVSGVRHIINHGCFSLVVLEKPY